MPSETSIQQLVQAQMNKELTEEKELVDSS